MGLYLPAPYITLHGLEEVGYNDCYFSEEGHRGYEKSGFHSRAEQGKQVIKDLHSSLFPCCCQQICLIVLHNNIRYFR